MYTSGVTSKLHLKQFSTPRFHVKQNLMKALQLKKFRKMRKLIKMNQRKIRIQKLNLKTVKGLNRANLLKLP